MLYDVHVDLKARSYSIHIGSDMRSEIGLIYYGVGLVWCMLAIADENTGGLYGDQVVASLQAADFSATMVLVPAGELSKSSEQLVALYSAALAAGLDRHGFIVALGGGVWAIWLVMRRPHFYEVPFVQVPTSLLAMVDSSVGGKKRASIWLRAKIWWGLSISRH